MSQAAWPASAGITISVISAMSPRFCSSKSAVSPNGSAAFAASRIPIVCGDGALPFGWK